MLIQRDASFTEIPHQRSNQDENKQIKDTNRTHFQLMER
jgi:hypothetical protein